MIFARDARWWPRRGWPHRAFLLGMLLPALSCGQSSDVPDAPDQTPGSLREPAAARCSIPQELSQVLPRSRRGEIRQLTAHGEHLYFSIGTALYRVAKQGGTEELLFSAGTDPLLAFTVRGPELRIVAGRTLLAVPSAGGRERVLAELPQVPLAAVIDAHSAYVLRRVDGTLSVAALDVTSGAIQVLSGPLRAASSLTRAAQSLYWTEDANQASPYAHVLMSLPIAGGEAREIALDIGSSRLALKLMTGSAEHLFLDVSLDFAADNSDATALALPGIYRMAASGGRAERLVERPLIDALGLLGAHAPSQVVAAGERVFILAGELNRPEVYSLANGGAPPQRHFCIALGDAAPAALSIAADSDPAAVYLALALQDESLILRRDL